MHSLKTCSKCKIEKNLDSFNTDNRARDKKESQCKLCRSLTHKVWASKNLDKIKENSQGWRLRNPEKVLSSRKQWNLENKEHKKLLNKAWNEANSDRVKELSMKWHLNNSDRFKETSKAWKANNRSSCTARERTREAAKIKAIPLWADLAKIKDIYKERERVSEETGVVHHVDHIVPLQGKTVCGLHVEYNLRVIPAKENLQKNAKLIEELL